MAGGIGYYSNELILTHAVDEKRLNRGVLVEMNFGFGYSLYLLNRYYRYKLKNVTLKDWIINHITCQPTINHIYASLRYLYGVLRCDKIYSSFWSGYLLSIADNCKRSPDK